VAEKSGGNGHAPRAGDKRKLLETVQSGNYLASLEAVRDKLAADMEELDSKVVAQVAAQLRAVMKEIEEQPKPQNVSVADDLRARREARRAAS
jgi:phage gp29-like protein